MSNLCDGLQVNKSTPIDSRYPIRTACRVSTAPPKALSAEAATPSKNSDSTQIPLASLAGPVADFARVGRTTIQTRSPEGRQSDDRYIPSRSKPNSPAQRNRSDPRRLVFGALPILSASLRILSANLLVAVIAASAHAQGPPLAPQAPSSPPSDQATGSSLREKLLSGSRVEFDYYDPLTAPRRYPGEAKFVLRVRHRFRYRYQTRPRGQQVELTVRPTITELEVGVEHTVLLPNYLETSPARWRHPLTRHELDHVAISADPRIDQIMQHLFRSVDEFRVVVDRSEVTDAGIRKRIRDRLDRRHAAVSRLIAHNYDVLDRLTRHGALPIPRRDEFFRWLYEADNLAAAEFPYLDQVHELLETEDYRGAKLLYLHEQGKDSKPPSAPTSSTDAQPAAELPQ